MGRKKLFDEDVVIQQAMLEFWENGYTDTTFAKLEQVTGVTGRSLVNSFGDKDALFTKSLGCYLMMVKGILEESFKVPGILAIKQFFLDLENSESQSPRNFGCLICNTIYEQDSSTNEVNALIDQFKTELKERFSESLKNDGVARESQRADFLLSVFWGMVTEIRRSRSTRVIASTNRSAFELLDSWKLETA